MKTRILVTGHRGFIGRNMTAWLTNQGYHVDGWEWDAGSLPDVKTYNWVIHLGAIANKNETNVDLVLTQNFEFSKSLFELCQDSGVNLQYASCSSVYGNNKAFDEYTPCYPQTAYAWSKYLFDRWVFQQSPTIMVQGFRYFNVYGKWMHLKGNQSSIIHKFRQQAKKHGYVEVWEDADKIRRDWVWVGDVCKLHTDFLDTVKGSGIWNVGSGITHTVMDIAETIAEQESAELKIIPSQNRRNQKSVCANLKHLKETIGKRQWLNLYEWLDTE